MKNLINKVFVVTGAGNGVGRALTLELLHQGAKVAALDISETYLKETERAADSKKPYLKTYVIDITNDELVAKIPELIEKDFGQIDGVINNAGIIQPFVKVMQLQTKDIDRVMRVNFLRNIKYVSCFLTLPS
jgi:NAD(P)-dependent dehydrogenase (short-subunit alcohol dehydrogenase family)